MVKHLRRCPLSKVDLDQNEWKSKQVHPSRDQTESQEDPSIQITYEYVQLGLKKSTTFCVVLCALAKHHCYIFGAVWEMRLVF